MYTFLGGLFDPEVRGHREKLKRMSPIDRETALLLMRSLGANLMCQRMWEDQIQLIGAGCPTFVNATGFDQDARGRGEARRGRRANGQGSAVVETGRDNSGGSGSDGRGGRGGDGETDGETNGGRRGRPIATRRRRPTSRRGKATAERRRSGAPNGDEPTATDVDVAPGDIARVTEAGESPVEAGRGRATGPGRGDRRPERREGTERTADRRRRRRRRDRPPRARRPPAPSETTAEGTAAKATGAGGRDRARERGRERTERGRAKVEAAEANPEAS